VVALEVWGTAIFTNVGFRELIQFEQADTRFGRTGRHPQGVGGQTASLPQLLDFAAAFDSDLFADGSHDSPG